MIRTQSNLKDLLNEAENDSKKTEHSKNKYRKNLEKSKKSSEKFKKSLELYICNLVDFEKNYIWSDDTIKDIIIKHYWKNPYYAPDIINSKTYILNTLQELSYKGRINLICFQNKTKTKYKLYFVSKKTNIAKPSENLPKQWEAQVARIGGNWKFPAGDATHLTTI
tara:strand:- start:30350 stop:30847 length:498 start_codon:yes stop_codon:yes gene_type:complete